MKAVYKISIYAVTAILAVPQKNNGRKYFAFIKYRGAAPIAFNSNFYGLKFEYHNKGNF